MKKVLFLTLLFFTHSMPRIQITFEDVVQQTCIQCGVFLTRADILLAQAFATKEGPLYLCQKCREAQERPWHGSGVQAAIEGLQPVCSSSQCSFSSGDVFQLTEYGHLLSSEQRQKIKKEADLLRAEQEAKEIARERAEKNQPRIRERKNWLPSWKSVVGFFAFWRTNNPEIRISSESSPPSLVLPVAHSLTLKIGDLEAYDNSLRKTTYQANDCCLKVQRGPINILHVLLPGLIREVTPFPGSENQILIVTDAGVFLHSEAEGLRKFSAQESVSQSPEEFLKEQHELAKKPVKKPQDHNAFRAQYHEYMQVDELPKEKDQFEQREKLVLHPDCKGKELYVQSHEMTEEEYEEWIKSQQPPNRPNRPPLLPPRNVRGIYFDEKGRSYHPGQTYIGKDGKVRTDV